MRRNIEFNFIEVDKWEDSNVGPGYTALKCKEHLQRPFYIIGCFKHLRLLKF